MMREEVGVNWIKSVLVPRIMKQDDFKYADVANCEVSPMEGMKDNWASMMFDIKLTLEENQRQRVFPMIVKLMDESEKVRKQLQSEKQFKNEIHLYSTVVPFFVSLIESPEMKADVQKLFPKCYYTHSVPVAGRGAPSLEDGVVAMENLKVDGFKLGNRTFLDLKHCTMAMESLGSFHALSYFAKERDLDAFQRTVVSPVQEANYDPEGREHYGKVFAASQQRVIDALERELPRDDPHLAQLRAIAARHAFDVFIDLAAPAEPLAVLCHGDFLRNNVLFRYAGEQPIAMKLIDFQTIRYASPAVDVSLFLCMNTSHALREAHFQDLLRAYHASLARTLAALGSTASHSYDAFLDDFRQHALYGYMIAVEFLPWMMAAEDELAEFVQLFREETGSPRYLEKARVLGGDAATTVLVELAKDFMEYGYF